MLPAGGYKCIAGDMRTSSTCTRRYARRCERTARRQGCVRVALFLPAGPLRSRCPTRNAIIAIGLPPRATGRTPTAAGAPWRCTVGDWSHTSGTAWTYGATSAPAVRANGVGTRRAVGGAGINATADAHHGRNGSGWRRSARSACAGLNRWAASRRGAAGGTGGAHLSCLRRLRLALGLGTFSHTRDTDLAARACGWQLGSEGTFPASQTESRLHTRPAGRARHAGPVPHMSGRSGEVNPITCYTLLARCISA